jgi:hypothetical protein
MSGGPISHRKAPQRVHRTVQISDGSHGNIGGKGKPVVRIDTLAAGLAWCGPGARAPDIGVLPKWLIGASRELSSRGLMHARP